MREEMWSGRIGTEKGWDWEEGKSEMGLRQECCRA